MTSRSIRAIVRRIERAMAKALYSNTSNTSARILVAISGGPDSSAALLALHDCAASRRWQLESAHFDHGIASPAVRTTFRTAAETLASRYGLPLHHASADVPGLVAGFGLEDAARRARYAFLDRVAREREMDAVVVGHTMDDQAETVLLHLIRGSSIDGLVGMRLRSSLPGGDSLGAAPLIRPLLGVRRRETVSLCQSCHVDFVEDPGNCDLTNLRNSLRLEILPKIAAWNPRITEALAGLTEGARRDRDFLESLTDRVIGDLAIDEESLNTEVTFSRRALHAYPLALQARVLRRLVISAGAGGLSQERTQALLRLLERGGHQVECGRGTVAQARGDQLYIGAQKRTSDPPAT